MADTPKSRAITGLTPRAGATDLTRMIASKRDSAPDVASRGVEAAAAPAATTPTPAPQQPVEPPPAPPTAKKQTPKAPKAARAATPAATGAKVHVSIYLPESVSESARAAFSATRHLEGDESWSSYVARAVAEETRRRERAHNEGQPFDAPAGRLSPGRPLGS